MKQFASSSFIHHVCLVAGGQWAMWLLSGASRYSVATWWKSPSLTGGIWGQINCPHLFKTDRIGQSHLSAGKSQKSVHCSRSRWAGHVSVSSVPLFPDGFQQKNTIIRNIFAKKRPLYVAGLHPPMSSRTDRSTLVTGRKEWILGLSCTVAFVLMRVGVN